jgi:hypothetical protein
MTMGLQEVGSWKYKKAQGLSSARERAFVAGTEGCRAIDMNGSQLQDTRQDAIIVGSSICNGMLETQR